MKILLVCSQGGHLTQMQALAEAYQDHDVAWVTHDSPRAAALPDPTLVPEPGHNPFAYVTGFFRAIRILRRARPDVLLSTGSEIAIPFLFATRLLRIRTLYVDSLTRVASRSVTGRVAYWLADECFVQWPHMVEVYGPRAQYEGGIL